MNNAAEAINLRVQATAGSKPSDFNFSLTQDPNDLVQYLHNGVLDLSSAKKKNFLIGFTIISSADLRFPDLLSQAIWIKRGSTCPTTAGTGNGEFANGVLSNGKKTITIFNRNKKKDRFSYTLNFHEGKSKILIPYDPIIINSGDPPTMFPHEFVWAIAVPALALLALLGFKKYGGPRDLR